MSLLLDRLLIAQAQIEGLTLVTRDRSFEKYEVDVHACSCSAVAFSGDGSGVYGEGA
jgi:hypothetical protein